MIVFAFLFWISNNYNIGMSFYQKLNCICRYYDEILYKIKYTKILVSIQIIYKKSISNLLYPKKLM